MPNIYGVELTRQELARRVGDLSQVAGIRRATLSEGVERGTDVLDARTGTGFNFTITPSRGMNIANAEYKGVPLAWMSPTGIVTPQFFEPNGSGALRSFFGGLLTTCGMTNVGLSGEEDGETLPFHGRVANIPATGVTTDARWEGNRLTLSAQGTIREISPHRGDLQLTRNISARVGDNKLRVSDVVENVGYVDSPFMYLYHINIGYPVLDEGAELVAPTRGAVGRDEAAEAGIKDRFRFAAPIAGFQEQVFSHDVAPDKNRHAWAAIINKGFDSGAGIGVYVRYHKTQFPNFLQWKMTGEGRYVVGLEPSNCFVDGRREERERGSLQFIEVGGRRHFETEIGVLTNQEEIAAFEERVARIRNE